MVISFPRLNQDVYVWPDVPEPPVGKPHVYDISRRSVSLSWCGPAYDGGSVITHYVIQVKDSSTKQWSTLVPDCQVT